VKANDVSANNKDSELSVGLPLDERPIFDLTTISPPSTPSRVAIRANSGIVSGESPGFLENPVYPLNSAPPSQMIPSLYDGIIKEAPSFAKNPVHPLNYVASGQIFPRLYDTTATEPVSLATNLVYPLNYVGPGQTHPSLYHATNTEAPSFITSPIYPLNYAMSGQATPSFYNAVDTEAPILSNETFSSAHTSLCNTTSWGTPVFSDGRNHP